MKELIEYIARAIVDNPDEVVVREEEEGDRIVFYLQVAESDMGKVIGKQGRIANAMRTLLKVAAAKGGVRRASLEIGE
ncbi:MAG: KH domain-containing protein [Dehalococcoidia bacterium]|nr:KH domain-containing protein [Dehalococcoidia bacterium]